MKTKGSFQVTTDGQYTEAGGKVLKAGFGVNIRTAKEILAITYGPSPKKHTSAVHEALAAKFGVEFAVGLKEVLKIKTLELASDYKPMVDMMHRARTPGSTAAKYLDNPTADDAQEYHIMAEIRKLIVEHFGLANVSFSHLYREANQAADLLGREVTDLRVTKLLIAPKLYEDTADQSKSYTKELNELLQRKEVIKNEEWSSVDSFPGWILYFQERDYKSSLAKTDRTTYLDNFYLRFELVKVYDFVIERMQHFSQPGTYGN